MMAVLKKLTRNTGKLLGAYQFFQCVIFYHCNDVNQVQHLLQRFHLLWVPQLCHCSPPVRRDQPVPQSSIPSLWPRGAWSQSGSRFREYPIYVTAAGLALLPSSLRGAASSSRQKPNVPNFSKDRSVSTDNGEKCWSKKSEQYTVSCLQLLEVGRIRWSGEYQRHLHPRP